MSWREDLSLGQVRVERMKFKNPNIETLTAQKTLYRTDPRVQALDPNAASQDVLLPPEAESAGDVFFFANNAGGVETLNVKDDSDTTTILALAQNENGILFCDGVAWHGIKS